MIRRHKDFQNPPKGLMDPKWDSLKDKCLTERNTHIKKASCYRDTTKDTLIPAYKHKCAFCEQDRGIDLQVDHYRPHKARKTLKEPEYDQPGYFWLTYEWSNLIPVCSRCNRNKWDKFPLKGKVETYRIDSCFDSSGNLIPARFNVAHLNQMERPLLLNPETEQKHFFKHFAFNELGVMIGRTEEGIETISLCDLNRQDLKRRRKKLVADLVVRLKSALRNWNQHKNNDQFHGELLSTFKGLRVRKRNDEEFTLFGRYLNKYFERLVISQLPTPKARKVIRQAWNYFCERE